MPRLFLDSAIPSHFDEGESYIVTNASNLFV